MGRRADFSGTKLCPAAFFSKPYQTRTRTRVVVTIGGTKSHGRAAGRLWGPLALASVLAACVSTPPTLAPRTTRRSDGPPPWSSGIAKAPIGEFRTFRGAELASARYAAVGGAVIQQVRDGERRLWRVEVIGRIGESPRSLRHRLANAR